ncbi:MAG: F-box protein [Kistimonas sp.]|nr:F-box protein [Kistimonas sp.]
MSLPVIPTGAPESRLSASSPALTAAAFGHAARVSQPQGTAATEASGTACPPQLPGQDLSRWPAELLEQILGYLDPFDLVRASGVCRHWFQVARAPRLQAHCFKHAADRLAQTWPPHCRQPLQQALTQGPGRQRLALWCDDLGRHLALGPAMTSLVTGQNWSSPMLFYALVQQMLQARSLQWRFDPVYCHADHWHYGNMRGAPAPGTTEPVLYSPDSNHLVLRHETPDYTNALWGLRIWRHSSDGLYMTGGCTLSAAPLPHGVTFSADSQQLLAVECLGRMRTWTWTDQPPEPPPPSHWQPSGTSRLCHARVTAVKFSPDASCLALQSHGNIQLFTVPANADAGQWQACVTRQWCSPALSQMQMREPDVMQFSADSRHFLFVNTNCFIFGCHAGRWQCQRLWQQDRCYLIDSAVLSAQGDWLALASIPQTDPSAPQPQHNIELWQRTQDRQWRFSQLLHCSDTWHKLALAFSPDGQQLVFPDNFKTGKPGVTVMSRRSGADWKPGARLHCHPSLQESSCDTEIFRLAYSAQGRYLAASTYAGIQLWQYDAGLWTSVTWIDNSGCTLPLTDPLLVFAPDGNHCAASTGTRETVSIYGPGPDGNYRKKMQFSDGHTLYQLQFAPGGLHLLVSFLWHEGVTERHGMHILRLEPDKTSPAVMPSTITTMS